jgi:hypothetical protein
MEHKFVLFKLAPINQCHVGHESSNITFVVTLALGSCLRQGLAKVRVKSEA